MMNIVTRQRDQKDCGVCCIATLIKYYGGYVPLERLRNDAYVTKEGTTAFHLVETLKKYQFQAFGMKLEFNQLNTIVLPAIMHFRYPKGYTHFVVLLKVFKHKVVLMDPAYGKITLTHKEFLAFWTNVAIVAYPKNKIPVLPKEQSLWRIFGKLLRKEKRVVWCLVLFSFLSTMLAVLLSCFSQFSYQFVVTSYQNTLFFFLLGFFAVFTFLKVCLNTMQEKLKNLCNKNFISEFLYAFLNHTFHLPIREYQNHNKGEFLARIKEAETILKELLEIFLSCFLNFSLTIVTCILLFFLHPVIAYYLLGGVLLYFGLSIVQSKTLVKVIFQKMNEEALFNTCLTEHLEVFPTMKYLNQTSFIMRRLEQQLSSYCQFNYQVKKILDTQMFYKNLVIEFTFLGVLGLGFYFIGENEFTLYEFLFLESLVNQFLLPVKQAIDLIPAFSYMKGLFAKISEFVAIEEEEYGLLEPFKNGLLTVKNVSFSYDGLHPSISNLSFKVKCASHVLVKGNSGCGKSTICKLLHRELEGFEGKILINRKNILDYSLETVRTNITYLSQQEALINGTIKENILFGREISAETFDDICQICSLEDIVEKRVFRYNEYIQVDDCNLSGGEKQRILLARALLNHAQIYLLDECLSEVDMNLEAKILKNIHTYFKNETILYISHKPELDLFDEVIYV